MTPARHPARIPLERPFHDVRWRPRAPAPRRLIGRLSCSFALSSRLSLSPLGSSRSAPGCRRARLLGSSPRSSGRGSFSAIERPRPAAARAGAASLREPRHRGDARRACGSEPSPARRRFRRDDQPRRARARSASSTSRRRTPLTSSASPNWVGRNVPFELAANGKCFLAFGGADEADAAELRKVRARGYATAHRRARGRAHRARRSRPRRPTATRSPRSPSPGPTTRLTSDRIAQLAPLLVEEAARARRAARPPRPRTRCRMTHDEILQGLYDNTLVGHAPEVKDLVNAGLADGMEPGIDALRRAHPVARGGRRALRARRLLRPGDADRRARDAGRARHPPPAARRDRRAAGRHVRHGHGQGRRARHRQEPRQHHARGRRLHRPRPRRQRRAREVHRGRSRSTSPTSSASPRSSPRRCRCSRRTSTRSRRPGSATT